MHGMCMHPYTGNSPGSTRMSTASSTMSHSRNSSSVPSAIAGVTVIREAASSGSWNRKSTVQISPGSIGRAQDCSQIVRIFHSIEHDHQGIFRTLRGDDVVKIVVLLGRRDGHHALVRCVARHLVEFCALQEPHGHLQAPAIFNQSLQADVVALLGHANPLESPPARLQRFGNGVNSIDVVHEYSVYRKAQQPRSGERMQPTAQAVGSRRTNVQAPEGRKKNTTQTRQEREIFSRAPTIANGSGRSV